MNHVDGYVEVVFHYTSEGETPRVDVSCGINDGCYKRLRTEWGASNLLRFYMKAGQSITCPGEQHCRLTIEEPLHDNTSQDGGDPTSLFKRTKKYTKLKPPVY